MSEKNATNQTPATVEDYGADSIKVLEGLEAVRARPGMYIGSTGKRGLAHMIHEIVDNSVDEHLAGYCSKITVTLEKDGSVTVEDDGRGVPVGMHEKGVPAERLIFTTLHAGGKFDSKSYKVSGGLHGVGSSVVNALSSRMRVEVDRDGWTWVDEYERGKPVTKLVKGLLPKTKKTDRTGTRINFLPDPEIFDTVVFSAKEATSRLKETAYLNPGLTIEFTDDRGDAPERATFHEPEGISGFVKELDAELEKVVPQPIRLHGTAEGIEVDVAVEWSNDFHETTLGFCNGIYNPEGGTHVTGFKSALTTLINGYARQLGILKDKDSNFTGADARNGMTAVVAVKHPDPRFEGQTKTKLDNQDAARVVAKVVSEEATLWFDRNVDVLKKVIERAEASAKIRRAEERAKTNMLTKPKFSFDSNGKLANCESREANKCEIFIVEGDSAGGSAKMARNRKYQAIMPIRGKILNVEKASVDKILGNAEIKTMINAFGCGFSEGFGNDFDVTKLRYGKIVIMSDADVDGSHILTLVLTLFYRFMPELLTEGHVYAAMPPLYKATDARGKEEYLYDDRALEKYRKTHKNFQLQRYKGLGEMDAEQLWDTTMNPATRMIKRVRVEDAAEASKTTEILMGTNVPTRKAFIVERAKEAEVDA